MDFQYIIGELSRNKHVFRNLLSGLSKDVYLWGPQANKWCLLEVVCHLCDEEREDFRARVKKTLEDPDAPFSPIDPEGWVTARNYLGEDYESKIREFEKERDDSVDWLRSLSSPKWQNISRHARLGEMSAEKFLANWLAHDYMHIRQINRMKYTYFQELSGQDLSYAGKW